MLTGFPGHENVGKVTFLMS